MVNLLAPPAIIFVNADLTDDVKSTIQKQLFINDTMTGEEFDARVGVDPIYVQQIHGGGLRVLVIRPFTEHTNRHLADIVLFYKAGMISVLKTKFGPPGGTYGLGRAYLSQLIFTSK